MLRGGLIGFGFIVSRGHLPTYLQRAAAGALKITAVADVSAGRRALAVELLPGVRVYADHREMLRREEFDFVDVGTPPTFHAEVVTAALERGVHVLCEKPLTTCPDEARDVLNLAAERERVVYPCHNYKHAPVVKAIRAEIDSGALGEIRGLTLSTYRNIHARGVLDWKADWRRQRLYGGGGIAMDHGSHAFYLAFDWFGRYPTAITAKVANLSNGLWDTEDNFSAVLTFPSGLATIHLSWTAGVRQVIYSIQGENGGLTVVDDVIERHLIEEPGEAPVSGPVRWRRDCRRIGSDWMDASHGHWFESLFDDFLEAIRLRRFVPRDAVDAYRCVEVIATAYRSAAEGCRELPLAACTPWD